MTKTSRLSLAVTLIFFPFLVLGNQDLSVIEARIFGETIVYGNEYTLGEIAEFEGYDVETIKQLSSLKIGVSPRPGVHQNIRKSFILNRLKKTFPQHTFKVTLPRSAFIKRASIEVTSEKIKSLIMQEAEEEYGQYESYKITFTNPVKPISISKGDISYEIKRMRGKSQIGGLVTWKLTFYIDNKKETQSYLRTKILVNDKVTASSSPLKPDPNQQEEGIIESQQNISKQTPSLKKRSNLLAGMNLTQNTNQGKISNSIARKKSADVLRGKTVVVIYNTPSISLETTATSLQNGVLGEIIKVRNSTSKKIITAKIIGKMKVSVIL